ncbi:RICIN domain-containing protein, partial [Roseisolibacter agri]|uniref:RICIN domain-containing protein n=1 Tax=Roseisolibacter agri TaxID=2014610 RepID=UPI0024E183C2
RCLNVAGAATNAGAPVIVYDCAGGVANERWSVGAVGQAQEVRVYGTLCLAAGTGAAGQLASTAWCTGTAAQRWTLTSTGTLQNAASGACLTTANNATANDTRAVLGACTAASARWTVLATP